MTEEVKDTVEEQKPKPAPKKKEKAPAKSKTKKYVCVRGPLWHPFQKIMIGEHPVPVEEDSWLESQIEAKLIKCL